MVYSADINCNRALSSGGESVNSHMDDLTYISQVAYTASV
jgi:hypothetical protein